MIPGPSSTEVALYIGYRRAGWRGLLIAGACFILPAALIVTAIAWAYVRFGRLPAVGGALYGVKAVIIAIVAQALVAFAQSALKSRWLFALACGAAVASAMGAPPVAVLVAAGCACAVTRAAQRARSDAALLIWTGAGASTVCWSSRRAREALSHLPEGRGRRVRQRLRPPRVPPSGPRRADALALGGTVD